MSEYTIILNLHTRMHKKIYEHEHKKKMNGSKKFFNLIFMFFFSFLNFVYFKIKIKNKQKKIDF